MFRIAGSILYCWLFLQGLSFGQPCNLQLAGYIVDKSTAIPLELATVFIEETGEGIVSDSSGYFQFNTLCPAGYHIRISHLGCETTHQYVAMLKDTVLRIALSHHTELLDEVIVHGSHEDNSAAVSHTIDREAITKSANKNVADLLEEISGVSILRNGAGISKPIVHGLYGNRITLLNNGLVQAGQQWGNDHAPEIDPFVADHLAVVKGAGALAYGGNALGSVVLVEPDAIRNDPHLHGGINYMMQSNGWGHTLNAQFEKQDNWAAWRATATLKKHGDSRSPSYLLKNTGKEEANFALQLQKKLSSQWQAEWYYSLFNTTIGVLRGAHISNLTDLQSAIGREEPFFTTDTFSYRIGAPRQRVQHHLLKAAANWQMSEHTFWKFTYGGQLNQRKEFDVRRGGRSDQPALSLEQQRHQLEAIVNQTFAEHYLLKAGVQWTMIDNTNVPETGISPLIPDYRSFNYATFLIAQREHNRFFYELGGRYDLAQLNVVRFSNSLPPMIERFNHTFHKYAVSSGAKWKVKDQLKLTINVGYMLRAPEVNELYSAGLHQGVSGIEEGNQQLNTEQSLKALASIDWALQSKFFLQLVGYHQHIKDYIYLQPQQEFRLTIRGAFPVFLYEQTDAQLYGVDLLAKYELANRIQWLAKYAMVRGDDERQAIPLINIPGDNIFSSVTYNFPEAGHWHNTHIGLNGRYVFRQDRLLAEQDFLAPPPGYFLLGLQAATDWQWSESSLKLNLRIENMLNTSYRDYLNRLRYFADELGINVTIGIHYSF